LGLSIVLIFNRLRRFGNRFFYHPEMQTSVLDPITTVTVMTVISPF